jgi:hypothetical protein
VSIRIYKTDDHWWNFPYVVARNRSVETVTSTLWGARRRARRLRNKPVKPGFWEYPYEEL